MLLLCAVFAFFAVSACGDSVEADEDVATTQEESSSSVKSSSSKLEYPDSFKPQDKEYPYAGIPRIVIETEYLCKYLGVAAAVEGDNWGRRAS